MIMKGDRGSSFKPWRDIKVWAGRESVVLDGTVCGNLVPDVHSGRTETHN